MHSQIHQNNMFKIQHSKKSTNQDQHHNHLVKFHKTVVELNHNLLLNQLKVNKSNNKKIKYMKNQFKSNNNYNNVIAVR